MCVAPKFLCWNLTLNVMVLEVIRSWRWSPHEWDYCSYKRPHRVRSPFHPRQQEDSCLWSKQFLPDTDPAPGSWISSLPNCEKINVCCLSYRVYGVFIIAAQTKTSWETSGFVATQKCGWPGDHWSVAGVWWGQSCWDCVLQSVEPDSRWLAPELHPSICREDGGNLPSLADTNFCLLLHVRWWLA